MNLLKVVAINIVIAFVLLALFDIGAYFFLPAGFYFNGYRGPNEREAHRLFFPRYYFEENVTRGFDIRPASKGVIAKNNYFFPVETNEFGCRDQKVFFDSAKPFIYAAGDSQTWGFVSTPVRWTSLLEKKLGISVLNCGVPGTGQRHQHEKYRHVIRLLKQRPDLVLVAYVTNDVWEDLKFPAYVVVDGFLVANDADASTLKVRVEEGIERLNNPPVVDQIKTALRRYSLSAQIIQTSWWSGTSIFRRPIDTTYDYSSSNVLTNKKGIEEFAHDVCSSGSRFAVLILPEAGRLSFPDYFSDLSRFLQAKGIFAIDFHRLMATEGLRTSELFQFDNPHLSEAGNARFADQLYAQIKRGGDEFGSCKNLEVFNGLSNIKRN